MDKPNGRASQTTNTKQENTRLFSVAVKSLYGEKHGFQKRGLANSKKPWQDATQWRVQTMAIIIIGKIKCKILTSLGATQTNGKIKSVVQARCAGKTWKRSVKRGTNVGRWKGACLRKSQNEITAADCLVRTYRWCVDKFRSAIGGRVRAVRRRDSPAPGAHDRHRCARTHRPDHGKETVKSCKVQRRWR